MSQHRQTRPLALLNVVLALGGLLVAAPTSALAYTTGNLIVDPSFESNPLIAYPLILGPPYTTGAWGAEVGVITGPANGITPASGALMLEMSDDGLTATQSFQLVNVSAYSTDINAGLATVDASALYNVPSDVPAASATVHTGFYNSSNALISATSTPGIMDSNAGTWQSLNINSFPIPVGTSFILLQTFYVNSTMISSNGGSRPGYVDDAMLTLTAIPEPSSIIMAVTAALGLVWMRKRR